MIVRKHLNLEDPNGHPGCGEDVVDAAIHGHRSLGPGLVESVYEARGHRIECGFASFALSRFAFPAGYYFLAGFGSRFIFKSSSVTVEDTPSAGTSSFAVQKSAFKTSRRKF